MSRPVNDFQIIESNIRYIIGHGAKILIWHVICIFAALGILLALNIAATLIGNQISDVKSEVVAAKDAAQKLAANGDAKTLHAEIEKLTTELAALRQKTDYLEELVHSLAQSEYERVKDDISRLSKHADTLSKKIVH